MKNVGSYEVSDISMLDKDTCCLTLTEFEEGGLVVGIVAEKWTDEGSWHFNDNYFDIDGDFVGAEESTHLSEYEKDECKRIIEEWIKGNV